MFGRLVVLTFAVFGAVGFAQAPEMAKQYQQRISGALDELEIVIGQFEEDVAKSGLNREAALLTYKRSSSAFLQDRGQAIEQLLERYANLSQQVVTLRSTHKIAQPVHLLLNADEKLMHGMLRDYSFGIPVTLAGFVYAGIGFFLGGLFGLILKYVSRLDIRRGEPRISS